jgi:hypothetical protein
MAFKYPLNPYGGLMVQPVALAGGLNDSLAIPDPTVSQTLTNFVIFRGRFAVRAPVTATVQLLDDQGSPAPVTSVLSARFHKLKLYVLALSQTTGKTYLYRLNPDGTSEGTPNSTQSTFVAVVWTGTPGSPTIPSPVMVSFDGGTASAPVSRLYISDYNNQYDTMFWNSDANTINNLQNDFADSGTLHNTRYTMMFKYQYTLWGSNFFQFGASTRPEMLRFSQPGLIPATEPDMVGAVGTTPQEWWNVDHREIGDRGDPVTAAGYAGGAEIVFKRRQTYALFGYDSDTWSTRLLSDKIGCVGPYAAATTEDGYTFFWSDRGPMMTDGQQVIDIGSNIRKLVQAIGFNALISCEYSVDDSIVYFAVPNSGSGTPNSYLAFQRQMSSGQMGGGLWASGQWLNFSNTPLLVSMMAASPNQTLPGPQAAPTSLTAVATDDSHINLAWTNGDTSSDTVTEVHRSTTNGFSPSGSSPGVGTCIAVLGGGVATYADTGLTQNVTYYYLVRHLRNTIYSANSNQGSDLTWLATPTPNAVSLSNGVTVSGSVLAGADVNIYRAAPNSAFTLLTTLSNPGASWSFNDTTTTCNLTYSYQTTASKASSHTSVFSTIASAIACILPPTIQSASASGQTLCDDNTITINWSGIQFHSYDTAKIYRKIDAGSFALVGTVPLLNQTFADDLFVTNGSHTYQWRVDSIENGSVSSSVTTNTLSSNHTNCKL